MTQSASQSHTISVPAPRAARIVDEVKAERLELMAQLDALKREHREVRVELSHLPEGSVERRIRSERVGEIEERIQLVGKQLEVNVAEMNDAVPPGMAFVEVPPPMPDVPHLPNEYVFLGSLFMLVTLLPLSVALARRLWHRGASAVAALPGDLMERINRMEHVAEATALEVERIGEGQRFMTALMSDNLESMRAVAAQAQRLESARARGMQRDASQHAGDRPLPGMITPV